jgi:hypothetical protein
VPYSPCKAFLILNFFLFIRNDGNTSVELSKDHKPGEDSEKRRITSSGGQLYQNGMPLGTIAT